VGYDLVGIGEFMLRLAARPPRRLEQADVLDVVVGGAEANVAAACARLGLSTAVISAVPDNAWGARCLRELAWHGVATHGIICRPGSRLGVYFLEYGTGPRPVRIIYDRRDSAFAGLVASEADWSLVRGARILHLTGITPALGDGPREVIRTAMREAAAAGVPVSFDINYRSRLWGPAEARAFLLEILPGVRYLFVGSDDAETVFGLSGPANSVLDGLRRLAPAAAVALTLGQAGSAVWAQGAIVQPSRLYTVADVVDRLGAGDAYAAGFLWAVLTGRSPQQAIDAATALAALKCTIWGDIPQVSRDELEELLASPSTEIRR
jgi:2-dehydro-3-deoxygluconokinase